MTRYVVLQNTDGGWKTCGHTDAASDKVAIKAVAGELGGGEYVAIPSRSWKPRTVQIDTNPTVKFTGA